MSPKVHEVTRLVLGNFRFEDRALDILSAMTAEEAKEHLSAHDDIALVLLDVVMESDQAGLKLVEYIRNELGNKNVRIVLRTGQPGQAPEHEVIIKYDINDYKEKTELTSQKLATTLFASLRSVPRHHDHRGEQARPRTRDRRLGAHLLAREHRRVRLRGAVAAGHADRHGQGRAVLQGGHAAAAIPARTS
jgi:CheY-like chemotaxis protein